MELKYAITDYVYTDELKNQLIDYCNLIGDNIEFHSDKWCCNKIARKKVYTARDVTIYFGTIPDKFKDITKYYVLKSLRGKQIRISTAIKIPCYLAVFFNFIYKEHGIIDLLNLNRALFSDFESFLKESYTVESTRYMIYGAVKQFLFSMKDWNEIDREYKISNPFSNEKIKHDDKYIPENIALKLDKIFYKEDIELTLRTVYWILRTIPSRISEILDMRIDCIKPYDDHWVIFIPTTKQNGGYIEAEVRSIHIEYTGHGKFLIDLIREQQELARSLQSYLLDKDKNALFANRVTYLLKVVENKFYYTETKNIIVMNPNCVNRRFKRICKLCNILDNEGEDYNLTTHQFRHTGITDRIDFGFTNPQVRLTTAHKNDTMIESSYNHTHLNKEKIIEKQKLVLKNTEKEPNDGAVFFRGKILNINEQLEKRLLRNIRSQKLKHGICSDITNCKSGIFECLKCKSFIPDVNDLGYFKEQVESLEIKAITFKNSPILLENIKYNLELNKKIVERIESALISEEGQKWEQYLKDC